MLRALSSLLVVFGSLATSIGHAEVSSTVTLASDYDFRGVTQTGEDPALQASIDYTPGSGGWYVGAWASNVKFPGYDGSVELDLYTGFAGGEEDGLGWDAGLVYYSYPDSDPSATEGELLGYPEIYAGLNYGLFDAKIWYSNDFGGSDESALSLDFNLTIPLPQNLSLLAHAGYSDGDGIDAVYGESYFDYAAGLGYSAGNFELALKYVGQDLDDSLNLDDRVVFTISTTFPWSK